MLDDRLREVAFAYSAAPGEKNDGSLTYRWSCRMAVCGSCGMIANDMPVLSCQAFLRDYYPGTLRIAPLSHFPIVRDLAVDQSDFLAKLERVKPYIITEEPRTPADGPNLQTPAQMDQYYQFWRVFRY